MQEGRHLPLLIVRIYEELGLDAAPLIRYREERRLRLQREYEERERRNEEQRRQADGANGCGRQGTGSSQENPSPLWILSACANLNRFPYRFARTEPCPEA